MEIKFAVDVERLAPETVRVFAAGDQLVGDLFHTLADRGQAIREAHIIRVVSADAFTQVCYLVVDLLAQSRTREDLATAQEPPELFWRRMCGAVAHRLSSETLVGEGTVEVAGVDGAPVDLSWAIAGERPDGGVTYRTVHMVRRGVLFAVGDVAVVILAPAPWGWSSPASWKAAARARAEIGPAKTFQDALLG